MIEKKEISKNFDSFGNKENNENELIDDIDDIPEIDYQEEESDPNVVNLESQGIEKKIEKEENKIIPNETEELNKSGKNNTNLDKEKDNSKKEGNLSILYFR